MTKVLTFFIAFGFLLLLITCNIAEKTSPPFTSWTTEYCDSTQSVEQWQVIDLVLPFAQADTLKEKLLTIPQIFVAIVKNGQIIRSSAVFATSFQGSATPITSIWALPQADTLTWLDRAYLWTLADRPDYPYNRYERLLNPTRTIFLTKRDSMMQAYLHHAPRYTLKIQSDLRGRGNQQRYLAMGKSVTPLSQHNFGLGADIVISLKGKPLKGIRFYQTFLDSVGSRFGLTWGGRFLGFIDPNHVQYFKNSSEMLEQFPELRFEFEPYIPYFKKRVQRMTEAGKAAKVEDTKALLQTLHELHLSKSCLCDTLIERPTPTFPSDLLVSFQKAGYQSSQDILLIGDLGSQTATLVHPSGIKKTLRLGKWVAKTEFR